MKNIGVAVIVAVAVVASAFAVKVGIENSKAVYSLFGYEGVVYRVNGANGRIDVLVPFRPDNAPMPADMALSLLVLGLAFLALEWKADRLVSLAAIPVAIGALSLAQHFAGWPLHWDELFPQMPVGADSAISGGMSRFTALSLLAAGLCILWL